MSKLNLVNTVIVEHRNAAGYLLGSYKGKNLITNAGRNWLCGIMGDAQAAPAKYIALTANADDPAVTDTALTGEYADSGLSRALGDYAHTANTDNFTIQKVFTCTADSKSVAKTGLFNAATTGTMFAVYKLPAPVTLNTNDTLTVTWTIDLGL